MITLISRTESRTTTNTMGSTLPAGGKAGDYLIYVVVSWAALPTGPPSGWTPWGDVGGTTSRLFFYGIPYTPGMTAPTMTFGAAGNHVGQMLLLRGVELSSPRNVIDGLNNQTASTAHRTPSVTTTRQDTLLLRVTTTGTGNASRTYTWPGSVYSALTTRATAGYRYLSVGLQNAPTVGATGTLDATFSESLYCYTATMALTPRRRVMFGTAPKKLMLGATEVQIRA